MPIAYPYNMSDWYGYDQDCSSAPIQIFITRANSSSTTGMCGVTTGTLAYYHGGSSPFPTTGDQLYSDSAGNNPTTIFNYKGVSINSASTAVQTITTNSSGIITVGALCP